MQYLLKRIYGLFWALKFFISCCCREAPIHNYNQQVVWAAVFLLLRLGGVAGWLWSKTQTE